MTIYLKSDTNNQEIDSLRSLIETTNANLTVSLQKAEDIKGHLQKIIPRSENDFSSNDELIAAIPPHLIVKAQSDFLGDFLLEKFSSLQKELSKQAIVESVSYGQNWLDRFSSLLRSFRGGSLVFSAGLALSLILVIGNAIRSHINSRREEIEILELVGATATFIRKPYLIEGTLMSTLAMSLALSGNFFLTSLLRDTSSETFDQLDLQTLIWLPGIGEHAGALVLAALIGYIGSYLCLSEVNTGWAAAGRNNTLYQFIGNLSSRRHHE
jgi:cell division transport system permease protein